MQYSLTSSTGETLNFPLSALPQAFADIPDPRRKQGRRYSLASLFSLAVAAVLANHHSVLAIAQWGANQSPQIQQALGFQPGSMPHQTTLQRLFKQIQPTDFAAVLAKLFEPKQVGQIRPRGSQGVALDGKAQRARLRYSQQTTHPVHAVSAFCHDLGGVLAQLVVDVEQHQAELSVASQAIEQIDWQGRVLTGDALYCQQAVCKQVVEAGGDYLVMVRDNQPTLLEDIKQVFAPLTTEEMERSGVHTIQPLATQTYWRVEKGHGRIEERCLRVSSELQGYHWWPYLAQVFEYTRRWTIGGVEKRQVSYGVTSLPESVSDAVQLAALKRGHWQIENGLHYVKDKSMGEDGCQIHVGYGADIMAMIRNTAITLIRRAGYRTIVSRLRYYSSHPHEALALLGILVD